ncbi:MAG: response regulator transcription factor [Verrucomicrobiales bacterium]|nr:response regulator transcription factor [Verrucomicrobiales bacterium]
MTTDASPQSITVWLIEDNRHFSEALECILACEDGIDLKESFRSAEDAIKNLVKKKAPQVIILDLGLPGMSGIEALPEILQLAPHCHVLVLTTDDGRSKVLSAISHGAAGYLLKGDDLDAIVSGIRDVVDGRAAINSRVSRMILDVFRNIPKPPPEAHLTEREAEILCLLADGKIKKEVAQHLDISYYTVDTHVKRIYKKLQVNNLSSAIARMTQSGEL